jgi:parallel beta-helix repeat protein
MGASVKALFTLITLLLMSATVWGYPAVATLQSGGDDPVVAAPDKGWPAGDLFPNHAQDYTIIKLTNNTYGDGQTFPEGYYFKYPGFNADGTKIAVSARNLVGGVAQPYEIWVMDYDAATQNVSNFQQITNNSGTGDVYWNTMAAWSATNPDLLLYLEVHNLSPNVIVTYDLATSTFAKGYDPALDSNGEDCTNPGFYGGYDDQFVFGSNYGGGTDRILLFDGTYPSTTVSSVNQNLDPSSNYDGTRVTYYSTNATYAGGSIYADFVGGAWIERPLGFGDPSAQEVPGYWSFYSGKPSNVILASRDQDGWSSAAGLGLYHPSGTMIADLLGSGGTSFKWTYANHNWRGPGGEVLFRSEEYSHPGYGNNIFVAVGQPSTVWVDDDWTDPNNCGGLAWGYDAFGSIQDALEVVAAGGTVNVAAGTYDEQIVIGKSVGIQGTGGPVITLPGAGLQSYTLEESGNTFYPMVFAYGGAMDGSRRVSGNGTIEVTIDGFAIDGNNSAASQIFAGILLRNCVESHVSNNTLYELLAGTGNPQTMGVLVYGGSDVEIDQNIVNDWSRCGIGIVGDGGSLPDPNATVTGNTVVGEGPLPDGSWAQNGIQVSGGAVATLTGNEVSDIAYIPATWAASAINLYQSGSGVTLTGNNVHDCQAALYLTYTSDVAISDNTFENNEFIMVLGGDNIAFGNNTFTGNDQGAYFGDATNVAMTNNIFTGNDYAVLADGIAAGLNFTGNEFKTSTSCAVYLAEYAGGEPTGVVFDENSFSGNAFGVANLTTVITDASGNWWGDVSGPALGSKAAATRIPRPRPADGHDIDVQAAVERLALNESAPGEGYADQQGKAGTGDAVSANVDYTPWLGGGTSTGSGYAGDFAVLYVDDDSPQNGTVTRIQEAVDLVEVGGIVHVEAGAYEEQVEVAKDITISGVGAATTTIQAPSALSKYFMTGTNKNYPIVYVHNANVRVEQLTIDGLGRGNAHYRFVGLAFWNAGGSVANAHITGVRDEPFSGAQHGVSLYANNDNGGTYSVDLSGVTVDDMQKTGVVLSGASLTATMTDCSVLGQGLTTTTAQNGIQVSGGADATINNCQVADIGYSGSGWVASGILLLNAGIVDIKGGSVNGSQASVIYQETDGAIDGLAISSTGIVSAEGISIRDYGVEKTAPGQRAPLAVSPLEDPVQLLEKGAPTTVTIANASITGVNEPGSYGIAVWSLGDNVSASVTDCDIADWEIGLVAYESGSSVSVVANNNMITGNALGFYSNAASTVDGEHNYWGSVICADVQAMVDGTVDYEPWCSADFSKCDFACTITEVWVHDIWSGSTPGQDLGGGMYFGYNAFAAIPDAIAFVANSGVVHVLPGDYPTGLVQFDKNLTITGDAVDLPVISATENTGGANPTSWFLVSGVTVAFENLSFDGLGFDVKYAIGYWDGGGTVKGCRFSNIKSGTYLGCGVLHYADTDFSIEGCEFSDIGRIGVFLFDYPARTRIIRGNAYTGKGGVDGLDYAVEVGAGASAIIENNSFKNCTAVASVDGSASAGILVTDYYGPGTTATLVGNEIENNTSGVAIGYDETDASVVTAIGNRLQGNTDGISSTGSILTEATSCWWGDAGGPNPVTKDTPAAVRPMRPDGTIAPAATSRSGVAGPVHYSPWVASSAADDDPGTAGWQPNLSAVGVSTNGTIQEGIDLVDAGGLVTVTAGLYPERIVINRPMTVRGATYGITKFGYTVPANYAWNVLTESIISNPEPALSTSNLVDILNTDDVIFEGFVVQSLNALANSANDQLLRVYAETQTCDNIVVRNCVIGPNTNVTVQDGTNGRMGLYLALPNYSNYDITNSLFAGNKIFDCKGNGNNVFIWGGAEAYNPANRGELTGTIIENNEIYGSHRSGIELSGSCDNLTIRGNAIYGNTGLPGDVPGKLKFGNGIVAIRMGSDKASPTAQGCINLTIEGNDIYGNEKNGIYLGPFNTNVVIDGNGIHDNGWDALRIDLEESYYGGYPQYDVTSGIVAAGNSFTANDSLVARVVGTPTNGFSLLAESNYWGTIGCQAIRALVSGAVDYDPWCNETLSYCGYTCVLAEVWVDDNYCSGCPNDGHVWGYDCFDNITDGVGAVSDGGLVHVLAGEYAQPVNIEGRSNITIQGAGIQASYFQPATTLDWNVGGYGGARKAAIRVVGSSGIKFQQMTMDFDLIKGNNIFGLLYWNSGGELSDNVLRNMSTPDYYEFVAYVRAPDLDADNRAQIDILRNTFRNTGRVALLTHDYVNAVVTGNTFDQADPDFGYAIEVGSMSTATIRKNTFRNYNTWAATDRSASAAIYVENAFTTGIGPLSKPVVIDSNLIYQCQYGIHAGNSYPGYSGDVDIQLTISRNHILNNATTGSESSGGILLTDEGRDAGSSLTATITDNIIERNGDQGIYMYTNGNGALDVDMIGNQVLDHFAGLTVKNFGSAGGSVYDLTIHGNQFRNSLNAEDDAGGGFWDDGVSVGNCWSDWKSNSGYPLRYVVSGYANTVDRFPTANCFGCCMCSTVGNVDRSEDCLITMSDLTVLIDHLFITLAPLVCVDEGNIDMSPDGLVTMGDLTVLIDHLFITLAPLSPCP